MTASSKFRRRRAFHPTVDSLEARRLLHGAAIDLTPHQQPQFEWRAWQPELEVHQQTAPWAVIASNVVYKGGVTVTEDSSAGTDLTPGQQHQFDWRAQQTGYEVQQQTVPWAVMASNVIYKGGVTVTMDPSATGLLAEIQGINWSVIDAHEGGVQLTAYVLPPRKFPNSGITVGVGVDLGQQSAQGLLNMGVSSELVTKLTPYLGLKGAAAQSFLNKNPLTLTADEAGELDSAIQQNDAEAVAALYDKATGGSNFGSLPGQAQTVIEDVHYLYGYLPTATPNFWTDVTSGQWAKTVTELQDFGDPSHQGRLTDDANLLQQAIDQGLLEAQPTPPPASSAPPPSVAPPTSSAPTASASAPSPSYTSTSLGNPALMTQIEAEIKYSAATAEALAVDAFNAGQINASQETSILYMIASNGASGGGSASAGNSSIFDIGDAIGAGASLFNSLGGLFG